MKVLMGIGCILLVFSYATASAQGCSDAGFCTAGALRGGQKHADTAKGRNSFGSSLSVGNGENGTFIITPQAEATVYVSPKSFLEVKLPFNFASGNLGTHNGIGDPIITYSRKLATLSSISIITTLGARIGVGNANATDKGAALPMPYQNSLGTTDLIMGIGASCGQYLGFSVGYQQPLIQYNENNYTPPVIYPTVAGPYDYFASRELKRRGDVLIRAEAHYQWKKIAAAAGPLFIYHLGEDTYTTALGNTASLTGSSGATLNIAARLTYTKAVGQYELLVGAPFIVRSYRPDGLTRSFVFTLRYTRFRK